MDNYDPGILCFQHSRNESKVFCFEIPLLCKFCKANLLNSELQIPPFRIPYPFKDSSNECNAVVIKPTFGDFLNNYENSSDLHIGVTDSEGFVVEYDIHGLRRSKTENWSQCLSIKVLPYVTPSVKSYWDDVLYETFMKNCWTSDRSRLKRTMKDRGDTIMYDAENYNCYTFVLSFLRTLQFQELKPFILDKVSFCKHFVAPQTHIAAKYISLYRQLKRNCI